ncbi:MAG: hypothetical protein WA982_05755 [Rubrobacteraceae bacterium]
MSPPAAQQRQSSTRGKAVAYPNAPAVVRYSCGCEVVTLAPGISCDRNRCSEAEAIHKHQALLGRRLMSLPEGEEAEKRTISKIEDLSKSMSRHRAGGRGQTDDEHSEHLVHRNREDGSTRERTD